MEKILRIASLVVCVLFSVLNILAADNHDFNMWAAGWCAGIAFMSVLFWD